MQLSNGYALSCSSNARFFCFKMIGTHVVHEMSAIVNALSCLGGQEITLCSGPWAHGQWNGGSGLTTMGNIHFHQKTEECVAFMLLPASFNMCIASASPLSPWQCSTITAWTVSTVAESLPACMQILSRVHRSAVLPPPLEQCFTRHTAASTSPRSSRL